MSLYNTKANINSFVEILFLLYFKKKEAVLLNVTVIQKPRHKNLHNSNSIPSIYEHFIETFNFFQYQVQKMSNMDKNVHEHLQ